MLGILASSLVLAVPINGNRYRANLRDTGPLTDLDGIDPRILRQIPEWERR
ncbi:MAG: hypothetical protein JNK34_07335 [Tabrizicola sp.]|nr:hypothetical protein [Tabrizicola sp.]